MFQNSFIKFALSFHKDNIKFHKMSIPQRGNTQRDRLAESLLKLKADVTAQDRMDAIKKLSFQKATISRYLNGIVNDNDTAVKLISFFRDKIAKREKAIA